MIADNCVENWGCVEPSKLFSSPVKTPTLNFLVKQILNENPKQNQDMEVDDRQFPFSQSNEWNLSQFNALTGSVIASSSSSPTIQSGSPSGSIVGSKKILKHKRGLREKVPNLKRVTFEIEKFVVDSIKNTDERINAESQMAIRLGAKPVKRLAKNYKKLKNERLLEKLTADANKKDDNTLLRTVSQNKNKQKNIKKNKKTKAPAKKVPIKKKTFKNKKSG